MVKPANSQVLVAAAAKPATAAATHILAHLVQAAAAPLPERQPGPRQSANSASREAGLVGAGYGVPNPMSADVPPVPVEVAHALRATAQGIVTRMGQDPQGLGGEAIEPGPAGMRPASIDAPAAPAVQPCWGACGVCDADTCARARMRSTGAGAGAALDTPPSNTGVNKVSEGGA